MNQFLADNIDQLDLALDQLALNDRNFDRFAFMLIDNVAELTLHRYVQDIGSENEFWARMNKPKHDPKEIEKALGQSFDSKISFACKVGLIDRDTRESIGYLHEFRNTAYHKGLRHDGILHSLAIFYLDCVCEMLLKYNPRYWVWRSTDKISHRAKKYLGDIRASSSKDIFEKAYERIRFLALSLDSDVVSDLANDAEETIDETDHHIGFISQDSPEEVSRDEVIIKSQSWEFAFTDEAKDFAQKNGCPEKCIGPYVEWLESNYNWPNKKDPIEKWRNRIKSLRSEKNKHKAIKKYCDFLSQTEKIRNSILESASQLDQYIQQQIDIARGK